jgi:hypothetical protein
MAQEYVDPFAITEVENAVPLVSTIVQMRKEIHTSCAGISQKARGLSHTNRHVALRLRAWETQLNRIREETMATSCLEELKELRAKCEAISDQLAEYSKR